MNDNKMQHQSDMKIVIDKINNAIGRMKINAETTKECIDNFGIPQYVKELLEQDIKLYEELIRDLSIPEITVHYSKA